MIDEFLHSLGQRRLGIRLTSVYGRGCGAVSLEKKGVLVPPRYPFTPPNAP